MKRLSFLLAAGCASAVLASSERSVFPYGVEWTVRNQTTQPVVVSGSDVKALDESAGAMPNTDDIARTVVEVDDMEAELSETWAAKSAQYADQLAGLVIRELDGRCVWSSLSGGEWVSLSGVDAEPGSWTVRVDLDYSLGDDGVKVRYSVKRKDESEFHDLRSDGGETWLPCGQDSGRVGGVTLGGYGAVASAREESGARQGYADVEDVFADIKMDYSGLSVDVNLNGSWGYDKIVVAVTDEKGQVAEVEEPLTAGAGHYRIDISSVVEAGKTYDYEAKLISRDGATGWADVPLKADEVKLFAEADWFGFNAGTAQNATLESTLTYDGATAQLRPTDPLVKGGIDPDREEPRESLTTVDAKIYVSGIVPEWDLSDYDVSAVQGALVLALREKEGRNWMVWSPDDASWVPVSASGRYPSYLADYDVKIEVDGRSNARAVRYSIKKVSGSTVDSSYAVLKDARGREWFGLPASFERMNRVALLGATGLKNLTARYKTTAPLSDVVVDETAKKVSVTASTQLDLAKTGMRPNQAYELAMPEGKKFHVRWTDAKNGTGETTRHAVAAGNVIEVREGAPANGLESFDSHALGLDPADELAKPAAVVKAGGMQSETGVTVHVPNVVKENLPDAGVEVLFQRQKSTDKGLTWTDDGAAVPVGGELTIPFTQGTLYRVNTVLR